MNEATADDVRGRVVGIYGAGMSLGFVIGPLGIPLFGIQQGWAFATCAVLVAAVAFVIAFLSRRARVEPEASLLSDLPRFTRTAPVLVLLVVTFGFVDATVIAIGPLQLVANGASQAEAATFVSVLHVGMIIAQPLLGYMLDRWDRWMVGAGCVFATALMFAIISTMSPDSLLLWPLTALGGAAFFGIYTSALAILGQEYRGSLLVAGAAAFSLAYAVGGVVGPAAVGSLMGAFPDIGFWPVTAFCLFVGLTVLGRRSVAKRSP